MPIGRAYEVREVALDARIRDQVAEVQVSQTFHNPGSTQIEAEYLFPLPDQAGVQNLVLMVDGRDLSVQDLRRIWREVQRQPDAAYVTIDEPHGKVRVARSGGYLLIRAADEDRPDGSGRPHAEPGRHVEVRIPVPVVDALLQGGGDRFDLAAAIAALARTGEGELVTVNGGHETVRMWVDADSEGR